MRFSQVNNSPRANGFPAGEANFGQAMFRSLERSTQDTRDGFDLYSAQASFAWHITFCKQNTAMLIICLAARWSGPTTSTRCFSAFWDYILRVCQSMRDSFLYPGKLHWFLYLMLSYFYDPSMFIFLWSSNFVEKVVLEMEHDDQDGISCHLSCVLLLYRERIWTNYHETSLEHQGQQQLTVE